MVVARAHQHDRILRKTGGGQRDGGSCVLRFRLHDDLRAGKLSRLGANMVQVGGARHDDGRGEAIVTGTATQCPFEQRFVADQGQKGLRHGLAAARPQSRAAASAQNDRVYHRHSRGAFRRIASVISIYRDTIPAAIHIAQALPGLPHCAPVRNRAGSRRDDIRWHRPADRCSDPGRGNCARAHRRRR